THTHSNAHTLTYTHSNAHTHTHTHSSSSTSISLLTSPLSVLFWVRMINMEKKRLKKRTWVETGEERRGEGGIGDKAEYHSCIKRVEKEVKKRENKKKKLTYILYNALQSHRRV